MAHIQGDIPWHDRRTIRTAVGRVDVGDSVRALSTRRRTWVLLGVAWGAIAIVLTSTSESLTHKTMWVVLICIVIAYVLRLFVGSFARSASNTFPDDPRKDPEWRLRQAHRRYIAFFGTYIEYTTARQRWISDVHSVTRHARSKGG